MCICIEIIALENSYIFNVGHNMKIIVLAQVWKQ